ncbi:MAG: protein kinase [Sandaracinaceae bacterium]
MIGRYGPYAIVGRLAIGGMAEILLARDDQADPSRRHLVIKRILPEHELDEAFVEMFLHEGKVGQRLRHPNLVVIHGFGELEGAHYIAMEWVDGVSLGKLIRRARSFGGVPPDIACAIAADVAAALAHAHQATDEAGRPLALVHRDVTPDNVMISFEGRVKLLDFGIAKASTRVQRTQAGVVKGKFAYMSPEQCRGQDVDRRTDLFALGVCLHETLTGQPLYVRDTEFETMEAIVHGEVPRLPADGSAEGEELAAIVARCLAKDPRQRFGSAQELRTALLGHLRTRGCDPPSVDLAAYLDDLFAKEKRGGPVLDTMPFGASYQSAARARGRGGPDLELPELDAVGALEPATVAPPRRPADAPVPSIRTTERAKPPERGLLARLALPSFDMAPVEEWLERIPPRAWYVAGGLALLLMVAVVVRLAVDLFGHEPEEAVAVVLTGSLSVTSDPPGATVWVDGEERGRTPLFVADVPTGSRVVRLERDGYLPHEGEAEVRARRVLDVAVALRPADAPVGGPMGRLTLTTEHPGRVFYRGRDLGRTPLNGVELPAGVVRLEVRLDDGRTFERGVLVRAGRATATYLDF